MSDAAGLRQQIVPLQPVSRGPGNGDVLEHAGRDTGNKIRSQKDVLGASTELGHGLSFRTREHREKIVRKKKHSKNMLGLD